MVIVHMQPAHPVRSALVGLAVVLLTAASARAQGAETPTGTVEGVVSTQSGAVKLPGVVVTIRPASGQDPVQVVSDADGHYSAAALPSARYRVVASLDGFEPVDKEAIVTAGGVVSLNL